MLGAPSVREAARKQLQALQVLATPTWFILLPSGHRLLRYLNKLLSRQYLFPCAAAFQRDVRSCLHIVASVHPHTLPQLARSSFLLVHAQDLRFHFTLTSPPSPS